MIGPTGGGRLVDEVVGLRRLLGHGVDGALQDVSFPAGDSADDIRTVPFKHPTTHDGPRAQVAFYGMTLDDLLELALNPEIDGGRVLENLYGWRRERLLLIIRGSLTFAASLVVALSVALLRGEVKTPVWVGIATLAGVVIVAGFGLLVLGRTLPALHREYLVAVRPYEALRP